MWLRLLRVILNGAFKLFCRNPDCIYKQGGDLVVHSTLVVSFIFIFTTAAVPIVNAQTAVDQEYISRRESPRNKASLARDYKVTEQAQRTAAISIVTSLVNEAKNYSDETLRVRTQARSADLLWTIDEPYARTLFLRAWSGAEKIDEAADQAIEEAKKKALSGRGGLTMIPPASSLRSEILSLAARRDPKFGNILIAKLRQENETANDPISETRNYFDPTEPQLAIAKRLEVALHLLNIGDTKQAKVFAEPALEFPTSPGIIFLCTLRQKDAAWADKQYMKILERSVRSSNSEATSVSLLSSYVLTPNYVVTATRRGRISNQFGEGAPTADIPTQLRTSFFEAAAAILLRPIPPPDRDVSITGRAGTYFTIARLLPLFESYAPQYVESLNTQLQILSPDAPETFRNGQDAMLRVGFASQTQSNDELAEILDKIANTGSSRERDTLYVEAIRQGVPKGDPRIRQFAEKIENENLRQQARSFTDLVAVRTALNTNDEAACLQLVRDNQLEPLHRVWAMVETARLIRNSNRPGALDLLEDADREAHRMELGDRNRVYALSSVAASFFVLDRLRSWAIAPDIVKAANSIPGFTGEEPKLSANLRSQNVFAMINAEEPSFNISNFFAVLARDDLQLALSVVNGLTGEPARATTSLALARAVLERTRANQFRKEERSR
jgi:hypothetical protein